MRGVALFVALFVALGACALNKPATATRADERIAIVASEQGPRGIRLVAIDEHGDRRFELIAPPDRITQDKNPAISPDGKWLVFASTRERTEGTSLWIAALGVEATPHRLTTGNAIDAHPVWMPDGSAIVFSSTRDGGDYDLYRLPIQRGEAGVVEVITASDGHEITPTVAPDGAVIYAAVKTDGTTVSSQLEERSPTGSTTVISDGPVDTSPAVSPDGKTIVFARPAVHLGKAHSELWLIERTHGGRAAQRLVALPITDESGPVWSRDGRFVFATSRLPGAETPTLFSSVVHVDLQESPRRARILGDRAVAVSRLTPAVAAMQLDATALRGDPEYLPELARIMAAKISEQQR